MKRNYGFIHEKIDIKILILFVLRRMPEPVSFDVLTDMTMCDDGISYFDFVDCVAELVKTEHIQLMDDNYSLTDKGARNGMITEYNLPFTVRMDVEQRTFEYRNKENRNTMIEASHTTNSDGTFSVKLSLSDGLGEIASIVLVAANEQQVLALEKGFRKNAENIYNTMIDIILG